MVRPSRFTSQSFVDAAITLVAEGGASAATLTAIARKVGGPTGSIYHRFESRAAILATAWVAIHGDFAGRVRAALLDNSGLLAALAIPAWARQNPTRARFLLLNDPGSLFGDAPPEALRLEVERQEHDLEESFGTYIRAATGVDRDPDPETVARGRFLIFDGPIALTSPHLAAGTPVPGFVDAVIREMHAGVATQRNRGLDLPQTDR
jgi:AcrR family transcriptional regulator